MLVHFINLNFFSQCFSALFASKSLGGVELHKPPTLFPKISGLNFFGRYISVIIYDLERIPHLKKVLFRLRRNFRSCLRVALLFAFFWSGHPLNKDGDSI